MKNIIHIYNLDTKRRTTNKSLIKKLLKDPQTEECLVCYMGEDNIQSMELLTYLQGEEVKVGEDIIKIPKEVV